MYEDYFHSCDNNPRDGCVQENELVTAIDSWKYDSTTYTMPWVMEAVTLYSRGTGCVN
jgi:maltose-binding protein MalE